MSVAELLPILQNLSESEKISIIEFLQADLDRQKQSQSSSNLTQNRLYRKEKILVIETSSLDHIDFNQFIGKLREDLHNNVSFA